MLKKTLLFLYCVVVVVMAAATFVEHANGYRLYGEWWFSLLWALLTAVAIVWFLQRRVRRPSVVMLHLSFVVILSGAGLTHVFSSQGAVHLRNGESTSRYMTEDGRLHPLPFTLRLDTFAVVYYKGTTSAADYESHLTLSDGQGWQKEAIVSMNNICSHNGIRLYQASYDDDGKGTVLGLNSDPWGIPTTYTGYAMLFIALVWILIDPKGQYRQVLRSPLLRSHRFGIRLTFGLLLSGFFLLAGYILRIDPQADKLLPVLNSPFLLFHVSIIMMAYALLSLTFICSLTALCLSLIKKSEPTAVNSLAMLSRVFLFPALTTLGMGIFIGAVWANISWGSYWSWDPKEVWALITFMVYAAVVHTQSLPVFRRPIAYHLYVTLAFLTILMTYFGVNYLLGGMHSYA